MHRPFTLLFLLGLGAALPAQDAKAPAPQHRLQRLLRDLRATDPTVWAARLADLEQRAKAHDADAAQLRQQAAAAQRAADAATAEAVALRAEQANLLELQQLLARLRAVELPTPSSGDEPAKAAAPGAKMPAAQPPDERPKAPAPPQAPADSDGFVTWADVAPMFAESCTSCHDPGEQKGGLDLTTFAAARSGGSGQSVVAGEPEQSRLYRLVARQERPFMPRNADPLAQEQLALLRTWIEHGAAEDIAGAKAFRRDRAALATAAADAAAAHDSTPTGAAPMPSTLPALPLNTPPRPGPIRSLVRSPTAPLLAMPGQRQVLLCDPDLQLLGVLACELPSIGTLAFAEDGSAVLAAGGEPGRRGSAVLFDVRTGAVLGTCGDETDVPLAAAVHRGAGFVALGGASKRARVHRLDDGREVMAGRHADFVLSLSFSPDGKWLAAGDRAGNVQVFEPERGQTLQTLAGHQGAVHAVLFDRTGKNLLTAGADGTLRLWDVAAGKERWRQNAHPNHQALAAAFGPADIVASCGSDGVIQLFTTGGRAVAKSPSAGEWLYAVAFAADDVVLAADWQGQVHRFERTKKTLTHTRPPARPQ